MRRLIYYTTVSLDGYFSAEDGSLDGFEPPTDEEHQYANDLVAGADAFIFRRVMYELMTYWDSEEATGPQASAVEREFATIYRSKPRHVFSRTLTSVDERATLVRDDIAGHVARLKAEDGGYLGLGCGPELLAFFLEQHLIDEVRLRVIPVALGRGVSLFGALTEPQSFRLTSSAATARGGLFLTYEPE